MAGYQDEFSSVSKQPSTNKSEDWK